MNLQKRSFQSYLIAIVFIIMLFGVVRKMSVKNLTGELHSLISDLVN